MQWPWPFSTIPWCFSTMLMGGARSVSFPDADMYGWCSCRNFHVDLDLANVSARKSTWVWVFLLQAVVYAFLSTDASIADVRLAKLVQVTWKQPYLLIAFDEAIRVHNYKCSRPIMASKVVCIVWEAFRTLVTVNHHVLCTVSVKAYKIQSVVIQRCNLSLQFHAALAWKDIVVS
jgi:hypothetical protein